MTLRDEPGTKVAEARRCRLAASHGTPRAVAGSCAAPRFGCRGQPPFPEGPLPPLWSPRTGRCPRVPGIPPAGAGCEEARWYGAVEEQPAERTAGLLGVSPEDATYGTEPAFQALRQSLLKTRLAASGNPRCQGFRRLIEESVRPGSPRYSADLHAHMTLCAHCALAYEELSQLRDAPRTALAEGLLPWGGMVYVMGCTDRRNAADAPGAARWWPARRTAPATTAVGVALSPLLVYLLASGGSEPARAAGTVRTPPPAPAVTVTATASTAPSPSPTPSPTPPTTTPSPPPTPAPSRTKHASSTPTPTPAPPTAHPRTERTRRR